MYISNTERALLRLNLQFFGGDSGDGGNAEGGANANNGGANEGNTANGENEGNGGITTEAIEKLIQSRVDKSTADFGKKIAALQKENEKLKQANMTAEQIREQELADREKAFTEKEKALLERENRLYAIKAIKEIGLDDGSQQSLELVDFVMSDSEDTIKERVKSLKNLIDRLVTSKVNDTFKSNGREPNGGKGGEGGDDKELNFAEKIGKNKAEQAKKSNDILAHYLNGGNK